MNQKIPHNAQLKALKDRLYHLKSGRRQDAPVHDKIAMNEMSAKSISSPHLSSPFKQVKTPEIDLPKMVKSYDSVLDDLDIDQVIQIVLKRLEEEKNMAKNELISTEESHKEDESLGKSQEPFGKPFASEAQKRAMYAAAEGDSTIGIPKKVGKEYVEASKDQDTSKLPEKVKKAEAGGKILEGENDLYKKLKKRLEVWRRD